MRYRKKPVVVEAVRFGGSSTHAHCISRWMAGEPYVNPGIVTCDVTSVEIPTLEGVMKAQPGDYIIKGVQGEFYPCKPDIFEATYEAVHE
jgi:hypothetical protein